MLILNPLQSFPILLMISLYEHYVLMHASVCKSAQLFVQSIYSSLPCPFRSFPFIEAVMALPPVITHDLLRLTLKYLSDPSLYNTSALELLSDFHKA
jgi:hypothetical protein